MEFQNLIGSHQVTISKRVLSAVVPVLFLAISYIHPGKWAAVVEGGAHFGLDLIFLLLIFNFSAILCQYLSSRIAVVTGENLAKVCSKEYDSITCILLGAQAEASMIASDLMMVLGLAHGLNILFGIELLMGVLLTAISTLLFPFLAGLHENGKERFVLVFLSLFVFLFYIFGVFTSRVRNPPSMGETITRFSGESAFALMSLLGATIMPHTFYLHSYVVQALVPNNMPKEAICHDHLLAISSIFSGIFLVDFVLMNSAANELSSLITFQDTLNQVFRSSFAPTVLILLMFFSNQVMTLIWNLGGPVIVHDLFKLRIPCWLHHAAVRIIAILLALCSLWNSGAEGVYQLLMLAQVLAAFMLPSSVIPLFQVASSSLIMGIYKTSRFEELLALVTFLCMLGINILFSVELIFDNSEWVNDLWNTEGNVPTAYVTLVISASVSFCLMLWIVTTPLKSAYTRIDAHVSCWYTETSVPETSVDRQQNDVIVSEYQIDERIQTQEPALELEKSSGSFPDSSTSLTLDLPDTLYDSENVGQLKTIRGNRSETTTSSSSTGHDESSANQGGAYLGTTTLGKISDSESHNAFTLKTESVDKMEETLTAEEDLQLSRDDGELWESEEPMRELSESNPCVIFDGPGSLQNLSGKSDEPGSGTGSLSRLAGLGRAARRHLTVILDEFWGLMFDFHGNPTPVARAKKLDMLLGLDFKVDLKTISASDKMDSTGKGFTGYFPSVVRGGSNSLISSYLFNSPNQLGPSTLESSYGVQSTSSSLLSGQLQSDAYVRSNSLYSGERRYSSMHIPSSYSNHGRQPATVHGYKLASYLNMNAKDRCSGFIDGQTEVLDPKSSSFTSGHNVDSVTRPLGQNSQIRLSSLKPPGFHNISVSRNSSLQSDRSGCGFSSPKYIENVNSALNGKKFYSLMDISGLQIPHQDSLLPNEGGHRDISLAGGQIGSPTYECLNSRLRDNAHFGFDEFSSSKVHRDAFPLQVSSGSNTGSLWSRQPFEKTSFADGNQVEQEKVKQYHAQEKVSIVDLEAELLHSLRYCIMKLVKLEGSDWLFRQQDGADENLINCLAAREKFLYEAETVEVNQSDGVSQSHLYAERKAGFTLRTNEVDYTKFLVSSVPYCGEGCVYKLDLIISFGVWCIHRILQLSLMESRPELWGKYTFVLNRLQGIIDMAFSKPRSPMNPCFCLQLPAAWQQKSGPHISNESLPPQAEQGPGKCTTSAMILDVVKDVELAISCRRGRSGTAAGDVAFPKGKENLASVLKRYKRRLSKKPVGTEQGGSIPSRDVPSSVHHSL